MYIYVLLGLRLLLLVGLVVLTAVRCLALKSKNARLTPWALENSSLRSDSPLHTFTRASSTDSTRSAHHTLAQRPR